MLQVLAKVTSSRDPRAVQYHRAALLATGVGATAAAGRSSHVAVGEVHRCDQCPQADPGCTCVLPVGCICRPDEKTLLAAHAKVSHGELTPIGHQCLAAPAERSAAVPAGAPALEGPPEREQRRAKRAARLEPPHPRR